MKLTLNKKTIKNLSKDAKALPADMTPQVGGGAESKFCPVPTTHETGVCNTNYNCI
jgi:hypothetical protein